MITHLGFTTNELGWCFAELLLADFRTNNLAADGFPEIQINWGDSAFRVCLTLGPVQAVAGPFSHEAAKTLVGAFRDGSLSPTTLPGIFEQIQTTVTTLEAGVANASR